MHAPPSSVHGNSGLGNDRGSEKAPFVLAPLQLDDECAFEPGLGEDHVRLTRRLAAGRRERVVRGATSVECLKSDLSTPSAISR